MPHAHDATMMTADARRRWMEHSSEHTIHPSSYIIHSVVAENAQLLRMRAHIYAHIMHAKFARDRRASSRGHTSQRDARALKRCADYEYYIVEKILGTTRLHATFRPHRAQSICTQDHRDHRQRDHYPPSSSSASSEEGSRDCEQPKLQPHDTTTDTQMPGERTSHT